MQCCLELSVSCHPNRTSLVADVECLFGRDFGRFVFKSFPPNGMPSNITMFLFPRSRGSEIDYKLVQDDEENTYAAKKARNAKRSISITNALPWTAAMLFALLSGWLWVHSDSSGSSDSFERGWKTDFSKVSQHRTLNQIR
jgi:hypothetical protein